jgi:ferrochelatase
MNDMTFSGKAPAPVPLPPDHPPVRAAKTGVLIVNLGTPDATDYWSMRRYLKEFLSDRRVIETNRTLWWFVLNVIILSRRPQKKGRDYDKIWNRERDESPLKTITRDQAERLAKAYSGEPKVVVDWAMRYGNPSIRSRLLGLQEQGCDRVLVVPLYPQYAAATTATVGDKVFETLKDMRWQPALRIAPPWHDEPVYIEAVAESIEREISGLSWKPDAIIASFHGVPLEYLLKGDPYHCQCVKSARLLRERLGMNADSFILTFQSRFGTDEWLQPYTDKTVEALARKGMKNLAIVTPGFVADCLETIEEIGMENGDIFRAHGGVNFAAIPCLNASEAGMRVLGHVVARELGGWV